MNNDFNLSDRLSMRFDDGKGSSRISSRLNDGVPTDKKSFPCHKEILKRQKKRGLNFDTVNPEFIKFLKYGIVRDYNEWFLPRSLGDVKVFNKKMNCSITVSANFGSTLTVYLHKDLNQRRLKDRITGERKYVTLSLNLSTLIKAPFGFVTVFPDDPNPMFNSYDSSKSLPTTSNDPTHDTSSSCYNLSQPKPIETNSVAIQTVDETWDTQTDCQLTASLWSTEFAIAEFEQENKNFLIEPEVPLRCAIRLRGNPKPKADRAESKLEFSEKVNSHLFKENKEVEQQTVEATSKAESLQSEQLEANKTNILLTKNWMTMISQTKDF